MARGSTRARKQASADRPGVADPTAPLDGGELLTAARPVLSLLRTDLEARATDPGVTRALEARYEDEKQRKLTGDSFAAWREARIAQIAASWFLSCVFVRTLEDRGLLGQARLAGPGAMDSQAMFFQLAPSLTERDYLLFVFRELAELPASRALFDREHALVWQLSPSAEAAKELLRLFRTPSAETPAFRFGQASTRFLGDLYQDLYEDVRKRFALLQTPDFIERFILDRTLDPAIERFGLDETTLIDPTCGSGHFLLGAFDRLFEHRLRQTPGIDVKQAAQRALDAVFGADINPYAVAIARMRLLLAFLEKAGIQKLKDAPAPKLHLVVADSLRYNPQHVQLAMEHHATQDAKDWVGDAFPLEDDQAARDVLLHQYAAVVGNPPYITEKDPAKRETYRAMYPRSAAGKYALSAPFCERFFQLARDRGYVGQITANSFMKREFGKALIEEYLPTVNLELIVNTSGAYIPGHGTPTVLLFGTHEPPVAREVGAVLAKRGEPSTPDDPAKGEVWTSIAEHWNEPSFENDYISVARAERDKLAKHPWSLGGGGAVELKELLEERAESRLGDIATSIGFMAITGEDDVFARPREAWLRCGAESDWILDFGVGEEIRDWAGTSSLAVAFPYRDAKLKTPDCYPGLAKLLWPYRHVLLNRPVFGGKTYADVGRTWFEYHQIPLARLAVPLSITLAEVATHNHFVLDRGGKVFKQTAPIIKLPASATEEDHLALLAYLNSSTACFWLKQVCFPKGMHNGSAANATPFLVRFAYDGSKLSKIPLPPAFQGRMRSRYVELGRRADALARERLAKSLVGIIDGVRSPDDLQRQFEKTLVERTALLAALVAVQEEIDWLVYVDFGLADERLLAEVAPASLQLGARPFEVAGHRAGLADVREWFQWNETSVAEPPADAAALIEQRIRAMTASDELALLERGEFKRRWVQPLGKAAQFLETDARMLARQLISWLAARIESHVQACATVVTRCELKRLFESDAPLMATHQWLVTNGHLTESLEELIAQDAVPAIAAHRYSEAGMAVFQEWQEVWAFQRAEDGGKERKPGTAPRKYEPGDFSEGYYSLRGPLDVPKERFISYPGCESDQDGEPIYGWAGWNHLQRAQALAALYQKRKTEEGWTPARLTPMLAGLLELLPWIQQWHNEIEPEYGLRMGDYFAQFLDGELATLGLTRAQLEAWRPTKNRSRRANANVHEDAPAKARKRTTATSEGGGADDAPAPRRARRGRANPEPTEGSGAAVAAGGDSTATRRKKRKPGESPEDQQ